MTDDEKIDGSDLFSFLTKLSKVEKLNIIEWYTALPLVEREYVDIIRQEGISEAVFFECNPDF